MTKHFIPQPQGDDVCPCDRCAPGDCEAIAMINRLRQQKARQRQEEAE